MYSKFQKIQKKKRSLDLIEKISEMCCLRRKKTEIYGKWP